MIVADFSMIPMGSGTSGSTYVRAVHDLLRELNVKFIPGPMSTAVETESFEQLFEIIEKANQRLGENGIQRIITSIRIDYRLDKEITIESKLGAIGK
ncbi:MAG TPA: MTH1187 family thiamine-binding protein [Methanothrix sp.]|nr:MTH1187 family thiamine-binding protein [Methanothrix sp.]